MPVDDGTATVVGMIPLKLNDDGTLCEALAGEWLREQASSYAVVLRIARHFGLPLEAVILKDAAIGPIVRRLRKLVCDDDEKAAA